MNTNPSEGPGRSEDSFARSRAAGEDAMARTKAEASRTADDLKHKGEDLASAAREQAESIAKRQKDAGAEGIEGVARAVEKAADELEKSSPQLARHARDAASRVSGMSDALRNRSVGDLFDDVNSYAKSQPAAFFGAAIVAGFALSRFLGSSAGRGATATDPYSAGRR